MAVLRHLDLRPFASIIAKSSDDVPKVSYCANYQIIDTKT
jgi:hypothetical protein